MPDLEPLAAHHAKALLAFERENRAWFARAVPDRGDDYFTGFAARHAALLAEQVRRGGALPHAVDDDGTIMVVLNWRSAERRSRAGRPGAERAAGSGRT